MTMRSFLMIACMSATLMASGAAMAEQGRGHGHTRGHGTDVPRHVVAIEDNDRGRIRNFLSEHARKDCPPGLAKKHNGCLPPGQAKKYHVGDVLVAEHPRTIWQALADMISPPPAGYKYVRDDRAVLLVDSNNRIVDVVDAD